MQELELLRFTTAGSVDDGKSTLIGRLLYDSRQICQDQMDALERIMKLRGEETVNLALLTNGLRAEREQGITIDVAYRYFSTPKRKFIIADTPGHEQYTRNMVTGASSANLAVILIDARNGILTQSKRHGVIASMLGIPHLLVAVNKLDLVGWSEARFNEIVEEYTEYSRKLNIHDIQFIPVSALLGDNIVDASANMDWYLGPTVLQHLENVVITSDWNLQDFRFPVQYVIRPHQDFRGFAGRVASGTVRPGEEVIALPSGMKSTLKAIHTDGTTVDEAFAGQSVVLTLEDEIDLSRGEMLVRTHNLPHVGTEFDANICWMDSTAELDLSRRYIIQMGPRVTHAHIRELTYRLDVNTLHRERASTLALNEIGRISLATAQLVFFDPYDRNRETGSFILIDPGTNLTAAAGMVRYESGHLEEQSTKPVSANVRWENHLVTRQMRETVQGHRAVCLWLTGLSGSGKSTIARELERRLFEDGRNVYMLDGDNIRHGLNGDLGFSPRDRDENIRRAGHVARLMYDAGCIVICAFISPVEGLRDVVRALFPADAFREVYVQCDIKECIRRDPKGLYAKALSGEVKEFTGISAPYEAPRNPEMTIYTTQMTPDETVQLLIDSLSLD
jgi:bifunctional enzyme CysN/CysC